MSREGAAKGRSRAPAGYYSDLAKGDVKASKMEEQQKMEEPRKHDEDKSVKGKTKGRSRAGSKASSQKGLRVEEGLEAQLDQESEDLAKELDDLEKLDGRSKALHKLAVSGEIQFIEDYEPRIELEKEEVWRKENEEHDQEENTIEVRLQRLQRKQELMERKHHLRQKRLLLMKEEKAMELKEKLRQIELGAEWLRMEKEEHEVDQKWQQQQRDMENFQNSKRVQGWVHQAAVHVSRGDMASMKSGKSKKKEEQMVSENRKVKEMQEMGREVRPPGVMEESKLLQTKSCLLQQPDTGVQHLKRIGVLPSYGVDMDGERGHRLPKQNRSKMHGYEPREAFGDQWEIGSEREDGGKKVHSLDGEGVVKGDKEKNKIKSGKFAKSHQDLLREEKWPHLNVLRQYSKRVAFDQMEFDMFTAGETRIILSMCRKNPERGLGRLRVFSRICHWMCKCKDWQAVRNIFEAIIEQVELGDMDWDSNIDAFEALLPPPPSVLAQLRKGQEEVSKDKDRKKEGDTKKVGEVFWCKDFQKGVCTESGPHMAQLKPDEKPVWVVHICALCWQKDKVKRSHHEGDSTCPNKKT